MMGVAKGLSLLNLKVNDTHQTPAAEIRKAATRREAYLKARADHTLKIEEDGHDE